MDEKKKRWKPKKKTVVLLTAAALVGVLVWRGCAGSGQVIYGETTVSQRDIVSYLEFSGNVEAVNTANVYAQAAAQITDVLVEEGDWVNAGDVIATLDSGDIEYNIQLKELALEQTRLNNSYSVRDSQKSLDNLNEQLDMGLNTSLNSAQKALLAAQEMYLDAADAYNQSKQAYEEGNSEPVASARQNAEMQQMIMDLAKSQGQIPDSLLENYQSPVDQARLTYEDTKASVKDGVDDAYEAMLDAKEAFEDAQRDYESTQLSVSQNVESYENALEKTEALANEKSSEMELTHLKDTLADYTICAPIDGYVTTLNLKNGDYTANAMAVAEVMNFDTMQVAIKIDEYDSSSVKEGDPVEIYMDAQGLTYKGSIARISKVATVMNDISYLEAIVEFAADDQVYSGFSAEVKLIKEAGNGVAALPVEVISYDEDNSAYVLKKDAKGAVFKQPVTLGVSDGSWVEIKEGVKTDGVIYSVPAFTMEDMMEMRAQMMGQ